MVEDETSGVASREDSNAPYALQNLTTNILKNAFFNKKTVSSTYEVALRINSHCRTLDPPIGVQWFHLVFYLESSLQIFVYFFKRSLFGLTLANNLCLQNFSFLGMQIADRIP